MSQVYYTPEFPNMDTQNDGLEEVTPSKYGHFGIYVEFFGGTFWIFRKSLQFWDIPKITKVLKLDDTIWQMIFEYITRSLGWTNKNHHV